MGQTARAGGLRWGVAVAALAGALLLIRVYQSPREKRAELPPMPAAAPVPEPDWGPKEHTARQHVQEFRARLDEVQSQHPALPHELARAYGNLGQVFLTYDLPASAAPCFQNASSLDPQEFRWPYLQAMAAFGMTDTAAAAAAMREAIRRLLDDDPPGTEHLAAAYCFLGEADMRLNRLDEARNDFDEAIALAPNSRFALFKRGQLAALAGDSEIALEDFLKSLSQFSGPRPPALGLAIATEYQKLGRHAEAAQYRPVSQAHSKDVVISYPNPLMAEVRALNRRPASIRGRAENELSQGNVEAAIEVLTQGAGYAPEAYELRILRAEIWLRLDRADAVIADLETLPATVRREAVCRNLLIQALARIPSRREEALAEAVAWRDAQPAETQPQMVLAALYFQMDRFREAREHFAAAARSATRDAGARLGEALALCALGEYVAARDQLVQAQADFPDDPEVGHHLARLLAACPDVAVRDPQRSLALIQALQSVQKSASFQESRACAVAANGDYDAARRLVSERIHQLGTAGQPSIRRRLLKILSVIETDEPWTEPWPFAEIDGP